MIELVLVGDDPPTRCRHCLHFVRYVGSHIDGRQVWADVDDRPDCRPGLAHTPMPDEADLRLAVLEAFYPEEFHA